MPLRYLKIWLLMFASFACKKSGGGAGANTPQPSGQIDASATVTDDNPAEFVQAGDSVQIGGTNLVADQAYNIELRLISAANSKTIYQGASSTPSFPVSFAGSGYVIAYAATPDGRTLAAVMAQAYNNQTANIRFDRTSTAAAKILEIIANDAKNGSPDARSAISNFLISVPQLYSLAYSTLLVVDEQERRVKMAQDSGSTVHFDPIDVTAIARKLANTVQSAYKTAGISAQDYAAKESAAVYGDFYKSSSDIPTEVAGFRSAQTSQTDIAYQVAKSSPLLAAAYSDAAFVLRPPVDNETAAALSTKAASTFMGTFEQCAIKNNCPAYEPIAPKQYFVGGTVAAPTFQALTRSTGTNKFVQISTITPNAKIYFTTDGSEPNETSSLYASPVAVTQSQVIKAFAAVNGMTSSQVSIGAPYSKSYYDHDLVTSKKLSKPALMMEGDLIILIVMHKYDQTDPTKIVDPIVPQGFVRFQKSNPLTGPIDASGPTARYQHVSIYSKKASSQEPDTYEISYPTNVDPDQLIGAILCIKSSGGLRDFAQGPAVSMETMAPIPSVAMQAGETVVYVATSLFLAEAVDDRENIMLFNNINSDDQHNYNQTATIMESNLHWRNKLGLAYDNAYNTDHPVDGFWASRGFYGNNYANSNLGMRFIITP